MEATMQETGFSLCDSSAVRAVAYRRLGSLPLSVAMGCCAIGEARLEDGRRVLITWGRYVLPTGQSWYAHNTEFSPVWVGDRKGRCELILGETFGQSAREDWLWLGMRIVQEEGVEWTPVGGGE
jgi:hypothetical protein